MGESASAGADITGTDESQSESPPDPPADPSSAGPPPADPPPASPPPADPPPASPPASDGGAGADGSSADSASASADISSSGPPPEASAEGQAAGEGTSDADNSSSAPPPADSALASRDVVAMPAGGDGTSAPAAAVAVVNDASVTITPDDGTDQDPHSLQVSSDAALVLNWSTSNAASVRIDPLGSFGASGSQAIPTEDASYSIVPLTDSGEAGSPWQIDISTHAPGEVVSPHATLGSGVAQILSFLATVNGEPASSVAPGTQVTFTLICSDGTESASINDAEYALSEVGDGTKQASAQITLQDAGNNTINALALQGGQQADSALITIAVETDDDATSVEGGGTVAPAAGVSGQMPQVTADGSISDDSSPADSPAADATATDSPPVDASGKGAEGTEINIVTFSDELWSAEMPEDPAAHITAGVSLVAEMSLSWLGPSDQKPAADETKAKAKAALVDLFVATVQSPVVTMLNNAKPTMTAEGIGGFDPIEVARKAGHTEVSLGKITIGKLAMQMPGIGKEFWACDLTVTLGTFDLTKPLDSGLFVATGSTSIGLLGSQSGTPGATPGAKVGLPSTMLLDGDLNLELEISVIGETIVDLIRNAGIDLGEDALEDVTLDTVLDALVTAGGVELLIDLSVAAAGLGLVVMVAIIWQEATSASDAAAEANKMADDYRAGFLAGATPGMLGGVDMTNQNCSKGQTDGLFWAVGITNNATPNNPAAYESWKQKYSAPTSAHPDAPAWQTALNENVQAQLKGGKQADLSAVADKARAQAYDNAKVQVALKYLGENHLDADKDQLIATFWSEPVKWMGPQMPPSGFTWTVPPPKNVMDARYGDGTYDAWQANANKGAA